MHPHVFFKHTILHDCHCFSLRLKLVWYCSTRVRYCNVLKTTSWHYCILSTFLFVCSLSLFMLLGILLGPKYGSSVTQNMTQILSKCRQKYGSNMVKNMAQTPVKNMAQIRPKIWLQPQCLAAILLTLPDQSYIATYKILYCNLQILIL